MVTRRVVIRSVKTTMNARAVVRTRYQRVIFGHVAETAMAATREPTYLAAAEKAIDCFPGGGTTVDGKTDDKSLVARGWQRAGA